MAIDEIEILSSEQELDFKEFEQEKIKQIVQKRCKEIVAEEKDNELYNMLNANSNQEYHRVSFNGAIYKQIFFSLNKLLNQDNSYDEYITELETTFERALSMFIINTYYERLVKKINEITVQGDDYENHNMNVYLGAYNAKNVRRIKLQKNISIYGKNDMWAAMQEIEGLLPTKKKNGKNIFDIMNDVIYNYEGEIIGIKQDSSDLMSYEPRDPRLSGFHLTLAELRGIFLSKYHVDIFKDRHNAKMFIKSLRDSASHGEYENVENGIIISNSFEGQTKILKNYEQDGVSIFVTPGTDNSDIVFTNARLREIVKPMFEKIMNDTSITTAERMYYEILEKVYDSLGNGNYLQCIETLSNKNEYWMEYVLEILYKLSLFSMIQYNTEKFWTNIVKDTAAKNELLDSVFLQSSGYEYYQINRDGYRKNDSKVDRNLIFDNESSLHTQPLSIDAKGSVTGVVTDIKNAIGHDNIMYSGNAIICKNVYSPLKEIGPIGINSSKTFRGGGDYSNPKGAEISFKVSDWINCLAQPEYFYAIARDKAEQEKISEEIINKRNLN